MGACCSAQQAATPASSKKYDVTKFQRTGGGGRRKYESDSDEDDKKTIGRDRGSDAIDISFAGDTLLNHVDLKTLSDRLMPEQTDTADVFAMEQLRSKNVYATLLKRSCEDQETLDKIVKALQSIVTVSNLPSDIIRILAEHMVLVSVPAGSVIVETGDIFSLIYIIDTGVLERGQETMSSVASRLSHVARLSIIKEMSGPWEVVGQIGNIVGGRSPCNIFARVDTTMWTIEREAVLNVCANYTRERNDKLLRYLSEVPLLNVLTEGERERLAGGMEPVYYEEGQTIFKFGDHGDSMYLIVDGCVECFIPDTDTAPTPCIRKVLVEGDVFGELALLKPDGKRSGDCVAMSKPRKMSTVEAEKLNEKTTSGSPEQSASKSKLICLMKLSRKDFDLLLGPLTDFIIDPSTVNTSATNNDIVLPIQNRNNAYEFRVLCETPGLQNLPSEISDAIAKKSKRYIIQPETVFGLTNPADSEPSSPKEETMQTLKVYYGDFSDNNVSPRITASRKEKERNKDEFAERTNDSDEDNHQNKAFVQRSLSGTNRDASLATELNANTDSESTDLDREVVNKEVMPGLFIMCQGEAGIVIGKGVDVLLGHMSTYNSQAYEMSAEHERGADPYAPIRRIGSTGRSSNTSLNTNLKKKNSTRYSKKINKDYLRAQRELDIRDTLTNHSAASLTRGLQKGNVVRGHVIGLQHLIFNLRPTLMKSKTRVEYLFIPRNAVEEFAGPLLEAFGLSQPSTSTVTTFLNETPALDKLLNKEIKRVAPTVQRTFLQKGDVLAYKGNKINSCYYVCHGYFHITDKRPNVIAALRDSMGKGGGGGPNAHTHLSALKSSGSPDESVDGQKQDGLKMSEFPKLKIETKEPTKRTSGRRRRSILKNHPLHHFSSTSLASITNQSKDSFEGLIMFQDALYDELASDATYTAATFTMLLTLHRSKLEKRLGDTLKSISDCEDSEFRLRLLKSVPTLSQLDEKEQQSMASAMKVKTFQPGDYIITQGDKAENAYIIGSGECIVTITVPSRSKIKSKKAHPSGLMQDKTRAMGSRISRSDSTDYDGDEEEGNRISNASACSMPSNDTSDGERGSFSFGIMGAAQSGATSAASIESGDLCTYGSDSEKSSHETSLSGSMGKNERERRMSEIQIAQLSRGHFFGESALLEDKPRNANVVAKTIVDCYVVSTKLFHSHLSTLSNDLKDRTSRNMQYREEKLKKYYTGSQFEASMNMKDVDIIGYLGQGIVGKVNLVKTKVGDHYYAVKCINKSFVVKNEMAADVVAEMKLLKSLHSPFINNIIFSDRDPEYVFMGFNVLPGGNLYARLRRHGPMSENECKFYTAGIINAIDFLHQRNIAHRDVKPENVVLDRYGYPLLIDFGCARSIVQQSTTICGTPLYVAPEILTCKGHTTAVDCWSFGVLVYELLTMQTPFKTNQDETVDDVYENIIDCCYSMPDCITPEASNLIDSLLQVRVSRRLGALRGKWMDVRSHEFFKGYDLSRVKTRSIDAPWIPDFQVSRDHEIVFSFLETRLGNEGDNEHVRIT